MFNETLISMSEAARLEGVHRNTVRNWVNAGVHGVTLESIRRGGLVLTSKEALIRFHQRNNKPGALADVRIDLDQQRAEANLNKLLGLAV